MTDVLTREPFRAVSLDELNAAAELQTRTDRKYIVDETQLDQVLAAGGAHVSVLEIDGRQEFAYESVYFDTPALDLYRAAATGRRHRFKVRTRMYVDSGLTMLEVKTKDGRGRTIKHRLDYDPADRHHLTPAGQRFVDEIVGVPGTAFTLSTVLMTQYRRTTIVDLTAGARATIDRGLTCIDRLDRRAGFDHVIVETKSALSASEFDRWFWRAGIRPSRISKYCTALAALRPELPSNRWNRALTDYFHPAAAG